MIIKIDNYHFLKKVINFPNINNNKITNKQNIY